MQGDIQQANANASKMESSLVESKHELLRVQEMLEMAEKELEKKVLTLALPTRLSIFAA